MSDPTTPNLGLSKPVVNADADTWGTTTNADWDILDAAWGALLAVIAPTFIGGLTLSTAGSSSTFAIAAGSAGGASGALMTLASSISKTTGSWAVGSTNGSLDSGTIANSTWYHAFLIKRVDTGVVDVLVSLSATSPALPTNYTLKRRIGSMKTDGSGNWVAFTQVGDEFLWTAKSQNVTDINLNPLTTPTRYSVDVPNGVSVVAHIRGWFQGDRTAGALAELMIASPLEAGITGVNTSGVVTAFVVTTNPSYNPVQGFTTDVVVDTGQAVLVCGATTGVLSSCLIRASAYGWRDSRGKN